MADKNKPIHILLIDDDIEYCQTLTTNARSQRFLIKHYQNLEEGFNELENNPKYQGLILDGRCLITASQETPKENFISEALRRIERIKYEKGWYIPCVINSAYIDELKNSIPDDIPYFSKGENNAGMFNYLRDEINKSNEMRIKNKYRQPFEIFERGYLDHHVEHDLVTIFKDMTHDDPAIVVRTLGRLRTIVEAVYTKMNQINKAVVPDNLSCRSIIYHLPGKPRYDTDLRKRVVTSDVFQPLFIYDLVNAAYTICSDYGSHFSDNHPTRYTVMSLTFGVCELLVWFGQWMDEQLRAKQS